MKLQLIFNYEDSEKKDKGTEEHLVNKIEDCNFDFKEMEGCRGISHYSFYREPEKVCVIRLRWILATSRSVWTVEVDNQCIKIQESQIEYFKKHYADLGYKIVEAK